MANVGTAVVELLTRDVSLSSGLTKAGASVKAFDATASKSLDNVSTKSKGLGSTMASAFGGMQLVATAAAGAIVAFGVSSVKAYMDAEKNLAELQTALNNSPAIVDKSTAAFEEQATAIQNLVGQDDDL